MTGEAQFPAIVELMFEGGLQQIVVVVDVAVVGFAKEGRTGDAAPFIVRRDDTAIEGRAVAHELALHQQAGVRVQLPAERRRNEHSLTVDVIAEAVVVLYRQVHPGQNVTVIIQRRVDVHGGAVAIPAAGAGLQCGEGFRLGFLGDDVHRTAWIATTIKAGGWAFEHFDAFDVGHVRRAWIAAVGTEAVLVELRRGEAAHAVFVERQAAEVVLLRHATGKIQRALDAGAAQILEHTDGNHTDRLRDIANGRVGLGCAGRARGAVTLDRAGGGDSYSEVTLMASSSTVCDSSAKTGSPQ